MPPLDVAEIIIKSMAFPKATVILFRAWRTAFIEVGAYFPNKKLVIKVKINQRYNKTLQFNLWANSNLNSKYVCFYMC